MDAERLRRQVGMDRGLRVERGNAPVRLECVVGLKGGARVSVIDRKRYGGMLDEDGYVES